MKPYFKAALTASALAWLTNSAAAQSPASTQSSVAPDNTGNNRNANASGTADTQKDNAVDMGMAKRIRQSVIADKSLSTYAHNVKIVSVNGTVTLNGVVRSEEEKSSIEQKAETVAGKDRVVNELRVVPKK